MAGQLGLLQEILAGASLAVGIFLAGRYFGMLEAKVKNGKDNEGKIELLAKSISDRLDELIDQHHRDRRRNQRED